MEKTMQVIIRNAASSDAKVMAKLFYRVFFKRGQILFPIFYPFLKRDILKRLKDESSVSFIGSYNGDVVSVFRSKRKADHWFVDSFFIESDLLELHSGARLVILKSWASYLLSKLKDADGRMTLVFKSSVQRHVKGYGAVFRRLGYDIDYTELDKDQKETSNTSNPSYTLKLTVT